MDIEKLAADVARLDADFAAIKAALADLTTAANDVGLGSAVNAILSWIERSGGERLAPAIEVKRGD